MSCNRTALTTLAISLLMVALVVGLWLDGRHRSRLAAIDTRGTQLTQVLSRMPWQDLVGTRMGRGALDLLRSTGPDDALGYVAVVDPAGRPLAVVSGPDVALPPAVAGSSPADWFGTRVAEAAGDRFIEHFAPLLDQGTLAGFVRIGFRQPSLVPMPHEIPAVTSFAAPVLLMGLLFYLMVIRAVRPLRKASEQLGEALEGDTVRALELTASGEVGEFVANFNRVVAAARGRLDALEHEHHGALVHTRVLSYQKARVEAVLQSLPAGVLILDESGVATYANEKIEGLLGLAADGITGHRAAEWCEDQRLLGLLSSSGRGAANVGGTVEIDSPQAQGGRISVTAYPLFSPRDGSEVFGTLVVFTDVTAEVHARQARTELIAQLSHELKTPLNVIGMYAEMLLEPGAELESLAVEAGNVMHDEVERVGNLINNMLSISRIELGNVKLDRRRTRLGDFLRDVFDSAARGGHELGLRYRLDLPPDLGTVNIDKELLRIALNNLLSNAAKYNREGGEVVLGATEDDDEFRIYVADDGIGIAPDDRQRVFDKFYRSQSAEVNERPGHGLGLALAREIVGLHLGELRLESEPGSGSRFTMVLRKSRVLLKEAV